MSSIQQETNANTEFNTQASPSSTTNLGQNPQASESNISTSATNGSHSGSSETTGLGGGNQETYPEQRHAGAVGYGPQYTQSVGVGEKLTGVKETIVGKMKKDPELVEHGQLRKTGELKKREEEANETDPFASPEDKKDSTTQLAATNAPEGTEKATEQAEGKNTDGVKIMG